MKFLKSFGFSVLFVAALCSCENSNTEAEVETTEMVVSDDYDYFGDTVNTEGAFTLAELEQELSKDGKTAVKIKATINEICQQKGCWMNVELPSGEPMRIKFKDYAFFVPKDASGREAIMEGIAYYDTVSVADQRHYAEDAGKSEDEVNQINEPKAVLAFEAEGVAIKDNN